MRELALQQSIHTRLRPWVTKLLMSAALLSPLAALAQNAAATVVRPDGQIVMQSMKRATQFMMDKVSHQGGFVWSYLPDMSRRWGEMEANPTMYWIQPPGTATVGHLMLDAFHATGDTYYYDMAAKVADALIKGQHPSGGWNYMVDTAGEESLKRWYETIGKSGWRLEEFQYYYGNATFDDAGTSEASQFLLRMYMEKSEAKYRAPLQRAIDFVLQSQHASGGWPQRFPHPDAKTLGDKPAYPSYLTLNDDVVSENMKFLVMCYQALGDKRLLEPVHRAMDGLLKLQQPAPQAGWALQYTPHDLQPAAARGYEPRSLAPQATASAIETLFKFYSLTGDSKFLARIPEALAWLDKTRADPKSMPEWAVKQNRTHPTYIEIGTDRPLFSHRRGSNVYNGKYYWDYSPENALIHNFAYKKLDLAKLRQRYEELKATPGEQLRKSSPLFASERSPLPRYFALAPIQTSDLNVGFIGVSGKSVSPDQATRLIAELNADGYWPTPLKATSNPYKRPDDAGNVTPGDFAITFVGDAYDTSPYNTDKPVIGISTASYVKNLATLIEYLLQTK